MCEVIFLLNPSIYSLHYFIELISIKSNLAVFGALKWKVPANELLFY